MSGASEESKKKKILEIAEDLGVEQFPGRGRADPAAARRPLRRRRQGQRGIHPRSARMPACAQFSAGRFRICTKNSAICSISPRSKKRKCLMRLDERAQVRAERARHGETRARSKQTGPASRRDDRAIRVDLRARGEAEILGGSASTANPETFSIG
jgi:hypothetical protein